MLAVSAVPSTPDVTAHDTGTTIGVCSAGGQGTHTPSPRVRVRPIPDISPPVIDPRTALLPEPGPFIQGTLAISFTDDYEAASDPQDRRYFEPQRTLSKNLPEPQAWVTSMAQALVEVMSGARPAPQVIRWTTPEVYSAVARRNAFSGRRTVAARRAIVRRVRICEPADGVVEACAVVVDNGRVRALAMRVTGIDRRWVVSALQVG
jgi:hypothetical protein